MDEMKEIEENTEKVNLESMGDGKEEEEESEERMEDITIPELPEGKILELRLLSNWGDPNFIGLNSLEIFTSTGERADVEKISTNATEYNGNLESLLTEQIRCKDTEKMWCARKSDQDQDIILKLELKEMTKLALVRFWNYNASRVHAQIGVRYLEMSFEGKGIFRGELECAFSADSEFTPIMGETVLFTTSESILEMISLHDVCLINLPEETVPNTSLELLKADHLTPYRPSTCEEKDTPNTPVVNPTAPKFPAPPPTSYRQDVKVLQIELVSNWGMNGLIGLTGLELVDDHNQLIDESQFSVVTSEGTKEQATKLFNGRNLTRDPEDMWLVDFDSKTPVVITISFHEPISLKAISLWNYNSSFELSYAGAKASKIYVNGKVIRNVLFRKAIGFVYFDYVQDIVLDPNFTEQDFLSKGPSQSIGGFVFQIRLLSTWGDEFYIGLNGIELFNRKGELMKIRENNLAAFPESVNILPNIKNDLRTSNNLIASPNDTDLAKHMWLTALLPNRCARVFFVFDVQTYISKIVIYNYRKTPERGVRHISLTVDDLIIFSGEIPPSTETMTGKLEINLLDL
ncbi:Protein CBG12601 [Caenorhabditis briggsae]|uniref:Protein CBG12601 n=2 Tax=Caenorhabditis briggsae TaxID=6238 RepID=A8XG50_CAEBR|nr:Protein CBG12601 [Caenorhabditis briggsae]ULU12737.1 hypothetical protein L3Y34_015765 [Caenorhabditis briggsae]CAP31555.1 Protein CBG12601 [Caenorhabditis briggsae]